MSNKQEIMIYESSSGAFELSVDFKNDTIWATQAQIAELFGVERSVVTKHLNNILKSGELEENSICAIFAHMGNDGKQKYKTKHYNLDAILSVGYRTNSKQAIKFRQWANKILKDYLVNGAAINQKRLEQLNKTLEIISRSATPEISGIADILLNFANGLDLLDKYDHQCLEKPKIKGNTDWQLTYEEAMGFIQSMKFGSESSLFGHEKDESFKSSLGVIYQTFSGQELYPSVQEKAVNLLYLIVKNHSFSDGNKRIAAALFVYFLEKNNILKGRKGKLLIDNNTLAAMTLMFALSEPKEKEIMCNLAMNFLEE